MKDLKYLHFYSEHGCVKQGDQGEVCLTIPRSATVSNYNMLADGGFDSEGYFVLEYSTVGGQRPTVHRRPCFEAFDVDGNKVPLVAYDDLTTDGIRYTVAVRLPIGKYNKLSFAFCRGKGKRIDFTIHQMYTCSEAELPVYCYNLITERAEAFTTIDLSESFNHTFSPESLEVKLGGGRFFENERINLHNIPFTVSVSGNNCIAPPPPPAENDEIIENFGAKAKRRLCRPVSRDGETVIELGGKRITEIYFLMAIEGRRYQRCGFATQTTILGAYGNEVTLPLFLNDIEDFAVETVYTDGRRDLSLPLNVSHGKHGMTGDLSLYAIPADGSAVEKVIFRNRHLDNDLCLVALTVNETDQRLFPEMMIPDMPEKIEHRIDTDRYVKLDGDHLTLKNGAILMSFDLSRGLFLDRFENGFTPYFTFTPDSLIKIRRGDEILADFKTVGCFVEGDSAKIKLVSGALEFELDATLEAKMISFGI